MIGTTMDIPTLAGFVAMSFCALAAFLALLFHHNKLVTKYHEALRHIDELERIIEGRLHSEEEDR